MQKKLIGTANPPAWFYQSSLLSTVISQTWLWQLVFDAGLPIPIFFMEMGYF